MNASFLMLLAAAAIFRFLAVRARSAFKFGLTKLVPPKLRVLPASVGLLLDFPEELRVFRRAVLPLAALESLLNAASCAVVAATLWLCPPARIGSGDLDLLKHASLIILPLAALADF